MILVFIYDRKAFIIFTTGMYWEINWQTEIRISFDKDEVELCCRILRTL